MIGGSPVRRQPQGTADEAQVRAHRGEGRHPESVVGVEDACRDRDQRDEEDIRRSESQHLYREVELRGIPGEAGRADINEERRGDDADQRHHEQDDRQHRG